MGVRPLTYTRFHPDGTYSQKGTLVNDVLEGTIDYQKSDDAWLMQFLTTITEKEAKERFQLSDYIHTSYGDENRYLLLEGDVVIEGFIDPETHCQPLNTYGIIVNGNLTIKGGLLQSETEYGETKTIFVTGDLHAQSIRKGRGEMYIKGNLVVEQTIYAFVEQPFYEVDEYGRITVEGDTAATTIFVEAQYCKFGGHVQGLLINTGKINGAVADFDTTEPLLDELIANDKQPDNLLLQDYIHAGMPIIKEKYRAK